MQCDNRQVGVGPKALVTTMTITTRLLLNYYNAIECIDNANHSTSRQTFWRQTIWATDN